MSRQDTTLLNPFFEIEQTVQAAQLEYIESFNFVSKKPKPPELEDIKIAVEKIFNIRDLRTKTNVAPYPDARKMFVKLSFKNASLDASEIMGYIGKHRTSFYHNIRQAKNMIDTDKKYKDNHLQLLRLLNL